MAYNYLTNTGVIVADESTILAEVQQEYRDVFGADLDVSETSPAGKLITAEVKSRIGVIQNNANVANQINPNLAEGVFFDAVWAFLGGERLAESFSTFGTAPDLTGSPGTIIPQGSVAKTAAGDRFLSVGPLTLDGSGNGSVNFIAESGGPVPAGVGTLTQIVSSVIGWETINNTVAVTQGQNLETGAPARQRRRDTVALNARTGPESIISALRDVDGVLSVSFLQNVATTTQVIETISMVRNSIYACVDGGTDDDIGQALLTKSAGQAFNGPESVVVTDPVSLQDYTVNFERTTGTAIIIEVTANVPNSVVDPITTIRQSVLDYAAGLIGDDGGFISGNDVLPFEIGAAINADNPLIAIRKVEASEKAVPALSTDVLPIPINEKATIISADITVTLL